MKFSDSFFNPRERAPQPEHRPDGLVVTSGVVAKSYKIVDERTNSPLYKAVHQWAEEHNVEILAFQNGVGKVLTPGEHRIIDEDSLPDFVKKHLRFRSF
ncbi:MAG TPA: hypothetical protein PLB38_02810 [bacterium]|nr:hypothetical protein [bacterium]